MELDKVISSIRIGFVWILCCLGFGAGVAEQQWSYPCPIHGESNVGSADVGFVESIPDVWHQELTSLVNQAIHLFVHVWLC